MWNNIKKVLGRKEEGNLVLVDDSKVEYNDDYKNFLNESFQKEKKNAPNKEVRLYFLILGVDEGLLSFDEFLDKSCMPKYQAFFSDSKSLKKEGRIVLEGTIEADKKNWTREDVRVWRNFLSSVKEMVISPQEIEKRMLEFYSEFIQNNVSALAA